MKIFWTSDSIYSHWICSPEFADLSPVDVFRPQVEDPANFFDRFDFQSDLVHFDACFRRRFSLTGKGPFTLSVTADDFYRLTLNGKPVCFGPAPAHTHVYNVDTVDVTPFLNEGENLIALEVYYQGLLNREKVSADLRCGLYAELFDGEGNSLLTTGPDWKCERNRGYCSKEYFGYHTQFVQDYDFRLAPGEWQTVDYDDSGWHRASLKRDNGYTFVPATLPVMPFYEKRVPGERRPNGIFYDFGCESVGYIFLKVRGRSGDSLRIQSGEELNPDGTVRWKLRCNCIYNDLITLRDGEQSLLQIDYKGFRYCFLEFTDDLEILDFGVQIRHHPFPEQAFSLHTDNPTLDRILQICKNAVRVNSQYNYLDCVTREKGAYSGDMTIIGHAQLILTGNPDLFGKTLEDFVNGWPLEPAFCDYANCALMGNLAEYALQFPMQVLLYYRYSGDSERLKKFYRYSEMLLDWFRPYTREDGLLTAPFGSGVLGKEILVDWPASLRDGYDFPASPEVSVGCMTLINAFYLGAQDCVNRMREILNLPVRDLSTVKKAYRNTFYDPERKLFTDGEGSGHCSLHANAVSAFFDLMPEETFESYSGLVREKGLCCGVYMAYFVLKGLCRTGYRRQAFDLMLNDSLNSWVNMLRGGAETCWESWDASFKSNNSLCHAWASAPIILFAEEFLGLSVDLPDGNPGSLNPRLPEGLSHCTGTVPGTQGLLSVNL